MAVADITAPMQAPATDRVIEVARHLPDLWRRVEEKAPADKGEGTDEYHAYSERHAAALAELNATEALVSSMEAKTLAGAAVQLMMCWGQLDYLRDNDDEDYKVFARRLQSALKVVVAAAGVDLRAVVGNLYAPQWLFLDVNGADKPA